MTKTEDSHTICKCARLVNRDTRADMMMMGRFDRASNGEILVAEFYRKLKV